VGGFVTVAGAGDQLVPFLDEQLQVAMDVGLKLDDGLGREGVRDDLPLPCVVGPVAGVEQTALDADERIVEGAVRFR
jgi:hypothetical protein